MYGARAYIIAVFFNDTATTEIYTLSLHDALPISKAGRAADPRREARSGHREGAEAPRRVEGGRPARGDGGRRRDRKSTRLNSSHANISYAVFCLKKKNKQTLSHTGYAY